MKKILIVICLLIGILVNGQNLVPNPRFEDTVFCPWGLDQMNYCLHWNNFGMSPDYYNSCSDSGAVNVPYSWTYQIGHNASKAYAGLLIYYNPLAIPNYREFIGTQLIQPLQIGQLYYLSFYVNNAAYGHPYEIVEANKIGMKFTTVPFDSCCPPPLNNFAHLYTDSIIRDTTNWLKISGSFIADSAYSYVMIGNFFDDNHTDTIILPGMYFGGNGAYEFVSDICVTTDSIYNETWTNIPKELNKENQISIFPNPSNGEINIISVSPIEWIEILNSLGQIVYSTEILNTLQYKLSLTNMKAGLYFLKTKSRTSLSGSKINLIK